MGTVLSDKNTKKELLEGIAELTRRYETAISGNLPPETEIGMRCEEELKESVSSITAENIGTIGKMFESALKGLSGAINKYGEVQKAIELADKELTDYYGIKREANTLLALVEAGKEITAKIGSERQDKANEWSQRINDLAQQFNDETKRLNEQRKRDEEQFSYDFNKKKRLAEDTLNEEIASQRKKYENEVEDFDKELQSRKDSLDKREDGLEAREEKISDLEASIKDLEGYKDKYRDKIIEGNSLKKDHEQALALLRAEYDSKIIVKDSNIEMLNERIEKLEETIASLSEKLDNAYSNVKDVAANAVNGAIQGSMINTLKDVAANKDSKTGK